ncbi:MAG: peptidylprolyl isomerase [Spirochaetales bacterium]|nr:peptidylprolyl isomerase [Spirochaetales bacterium]
MNSKKILFICTFTILVSMFTFAQGISIAKPAASVNLIKSEMISVQQLNNQVEALRRISAQQTGQQAGNATKDDKLKILDMMISDIILKQGAEQAGIKATKPEIDNAINGQKAQIEQQARRTYTMEQFQQVVRQQGMSWDNYVEQISKQLVQQKFIMSLKSEEIQNSSTLPDNKDIETFYKKNRTQLTNPDMIRYSQIFISTINLNSTKAAEAKKKADAAYKKYQNGTASFEQLVNDYTEDTNAKYRNGDSGYLAYADTNAVAYFGKKFIDKIFELSVGEVSGVIKSNLGYHIVKVTEYREAKILSLDDPVMPGTDQTVREYIAQRLISQKQNEAVSNALNEIVADLKKDADVKIFEENIN